MSSPAAVAGVDWIDRLPPRWARRPVKSVFREKDERNGDSVRTLLSLTRRSGLIPQTEASDRIASTTDLSGYRVCRPGELVMNRMQAWSGMFATPKSEGVVSPDYCVFAPVVPIEVRYFEYLFKTPLLTEQFARLSKGIGSGFNRLYTPEFGAMVVPFPPLPEQAAIVRFLDYADRRIRRYIRAKQKLIKLLKEQRRATVRGAVTRGIDHLADLKPSGLSWVGDVPPHWQITRVKREFESLDHRRVPLSGTERGEMKLHLYDYYGASGAIDKVDGYLFDDSLLLLAEDGANLVLRNLPLAIIARGKFWVNNHAHVLKPRRGSLEYLAELMELANYTPWISGAAQPKLTQERLLTIPIVVPPPTEQDRIADWIRKQTGSLVRAIDQGRQQIELLREYRTRLIADVVTGKLDVREAAARLPDETENVAEPDEPEDQVDGEESADEDLELALAEAEA